MPYFDEGGAIEEYGEADWMIGRAVDWSMVSPPSNNFDNNKEQYNQNEYVNNTCTVYQAIGAYSDLMGVRVPLETRKEIVDLAVEQGLDPDYGWGVNRAVKLVADFFGDVSYARVLVASSDYYKAKEMGFSMMEGYKGNRIYNNDRDDDGIVQLNDWGPESYAHALRGVHPERKVDNYDYRRTNVYQLPQLEEKMKSGNIFSRAYFYFEKITMPTDNLPKHVGPERFPTQLQKEHVKAWETEVSKFLDEGGPETILRSVYESDDDRDLNIIQMKYLDDLKAVRERFADRE